MIAICPDFFTIGLEKQFKRILKKRLSRHEQLNAALNVQAVDFRHWENRCLGALITPWSMNLMLLPNEGDEWQNIGLGDGTQYHFPSGDYEFILTEEDGVGRFQCRAIGDSVFEFEDQQSAVIAAQTALIELMKSNSKN